MELWIVSLLLFGLSLVHALVVETWRDGMRKARSRPRIAQGVPDRVSVIVPARNAAITLIPLLQDLHAQDLPKTAIEVLVIDDHSEDGTAEVVQGLMRNWPQLRCIANDGTGKKAAITTGITHATGTVILLTDADARCGPSRVSTIVQRMVEERLDLAICPVHTEGHGFLGRLQEDEQAGLLAVAIGEAVAGRPLLGNGANLGFRREAFVAVGGYRNDRHASGDDVFLIHRMHLAGKRIGAVAHPDAIVRVQAETTWKGFVQQRLRWAGKMRSIQGWSMVAGSIGLLLPWALLAASCSAIGSITVAQWSFEASALLVASWLLWSVPVVALVGEVRNFLGQRHSKLVALADLLLFTVYSPLIALCSIAVRPTWKGRRI